MIEGLADSAEVSKQTSYRWWPSTVAFFGEALLERTMRGADLSVSTAADLGRICGRGSRRSAGLARPDGVTLTRAGIEVMAADPELGLGLNARLATPIREWVAERVSRRHADRDVRCWWICCCCCCWCCGGRLSHLALGERFVGRDLAR